MTPHQREAFDNPAPPAAAPHVHNDPAIVAMPAAPHPPEAAPAPAPSAPAHNDPAIAAMPPAPPLPEAAPAPPPPLAARVDNFEALPVGVAREAGLQPNTILAARAISARFPQIAHIGGVRPDPKPWHPNGLAIDVMIPNHRSAEGIALGNEILDFVMSNAGRFGLQDVIWRDIYYTPSGPQNTGYGHFDHLHITTRPSR